MTEDAGGRILCRELGERGNGGVEEVVGGERVARAVCSLSTDDVEFPTCRGSRVTHPPLGFTCPIVGKGEKRWWVE